MVSSGIAGKVLSLIMSFVMGFSGIPVGSILNNAAQYDKNQVAQERVQLLAEYFDALLQVQYDGSVYVVNDGDVFEDISEIPEGVDYIEVDISSIDNFLAFAEKVTGEDSIYGGDFAKIDFSALDGKNLSDTPAIELLYDAIQFLDDNSDYVAKVLTNDFDYGILGEVLPYAFGDDGTLDSFDLYEVIMEIFGLYYNQNDTYIGLYADENGTIRLARRNETRIYDDYGYYYTSTSEPVDECNHIGENTFHSRPFEEVKWEWDDKTQTSIEVPTGRYLRYCYTALTDEEKSQYSFDSFFVEIFQSYVVSMLYSLGMDRDAANSFVEGLDIGNSGMFAILPHIVRELAALGTDTFGDTFTHMIREFFVRMYGVRSVQSDFDPLDIRSRGISENDEGYEFILDNYYKNFIPGDYALFDLEHTVNGIKFEMFEASYKENGELVFYPYEEKISDKQIGDVVETIFDMHFAVPSNYKPESPNYDTFVTDEKTGVRYYIDEEGNVYKLFESVFPVAEGVSSETIASLKEKDLIASKDLYIYLDNSISKLPRESKLYLKDGYLYTSTKEDNGKTTWKCWTFEENTTFFKNLNAALAEICELVNPYYVYNNDQYDFINGAKEVGGGYFDQLNNIIATVIENSWTPEGKVELGWTAGDNKHLNENIMKFIRTITGRFFTDELTDDIDDLITLFDFFDEDESDRVANGLNSFRKLFNAEYYQGADLETIALDFLLCAFKVTDRFYLFEDYEMPDDVDSLEAFATCVVTFTTDTLFSDLNASSKYIKNGSLVKMSEEEWKDALLDEAFELFLRVTAREADPSLVVFTTDEIDNYKLMGWGYMEFLDEIFDRFYVYIDGLVAVCDDLQCELGVYDGNGPWYKISRILNALYPTALFSYCEKTYGDETLVFDIGVFLEDGIIANLLDLDLSGIFNIVTENENGMNPFYGNNYVKGALICLQNFVNAILPGSIKDKDIVSPDHLIDKHTMAGIVTRVIKAINDRKEEIIPVIVSWFDIFGLFDQFPYIDVKTGYEYYIREDEEGMYAEIMYYYGDSEKLPEVVELPKDLNGVPVKGLSNLYTLRNHTIVLHENIKYFDFDDYNYYNINLEIVDNNPYFEVVDDVVYSEDMTDILLYPKTKTDESFTVPSTVKYVYAETFSNANYLSTLKINEGTQAIYCSRNENSIYRLNYNLRDIYIPNSVEYIDVNVFDENRWNVLTIHGPINGYAYKLYNDTLIHYGENSWYGYCGYIFEYYIPDELFVTLNTEKQAVKSNIYVYGYSLPGATIKVYDGDKLIGKDNNVSASKYSKWEANVPLYKPVDTGSYHDIHVVAEKDGKKVSSQTIKVYYEKNAVVFKEFKMTHNNYYQATVTDETINRIHNMTWIPGGSTSIRVRILNGNKLAALYLVSNDGSKEHKVKMERAEGDYWVANNCFLGDPPGIIRLEGVIKNKGELETVQIGGDIKINYLIDPSGNVYEFSQSNPLEGVTATVQYYDNETYEWVTWDAEYYEQINPIVTAADGGFKWIVPKGQWRVVCEKEGYNTYISDSYYIPPEVTGLQYYMRTNEAPTVQECYYQDGVVTIVFDQFIPLDYISPYNFTVDGATNIVVNLGEDAQDGGGNYCNMRASKTVKLYCSDADYNLITTIPSTVKINGLRNYNYIPIAADTVVVPTDLTKYYNFTVETDKEEIAVGDVVTVTLSTEEKIEDALKVTVNNKSIFDTELYTYDEYGDIIETELIEIPETLTFDENGKASFKFIAGFEGVSYITFKVGGTTNNLYVHINAKAEAEHVHVYGDPVIEKSTCISTGYEYQECGCGDVIYTPYELVDHDPVAKVTEAASRTKASCRARATYYYTCSECDLVLTEGEVLENGNVRVADYFANGDLLDHDLAENGGCKNCSYVDLTVKPVCKHSNTETINIAPTCESAGLIGKVICKDCNETVKEGSVDPAIAHSFKDVKTNNDGTHTQYCYNTNADGWKCTESKINKCSDSKVVVNTIAPSCGKDGYTEYKCSVCDYKWTEKNGNALEHNIVIDKGVPATCTTPGLTDGMHCTLCNDATVVQQPIAIKGHTEIVVNAKNATAAEDGYTGDTVCSDCGVTLKTGSVIPKVDCSHSCHKTNIISKLIWKFMNIFNKLLRRNQVCACGAYHY